ncbi:MAG TPA: diguanylate cyclase [Methylophilaceae bacterium]|nr:diguanylate cyclase [Methylophilaceae bacterium]
MATQKNAVETIVETKPQDADFRIVAEDAPVMLWLTNAEGKVVFTNSKWKKFVGRQSEKGQIGGDAWINALHPDDLNTCMKVFEEAFTNHQHFEMEYRLKRSDGQYRYVLDTGEPYINKEGRFAGFIGSSTDITERKNHENQLRMSQLEMAQHNREMQFINELNSYLQVCRSFEETHPIIQHYVTKIFADHAGVLYLFDESHSLVEPVVRWGEPQHSSPTAILPDDCWGLRQGKLHMVDDTDNVIICNHMNGKETHGYVCAPVIAQGEMIGVLTVTLGGKTEQQITRSRESVTRLIAMAADNLAMALVSLKLREALRNRSVRDPLTKLYNRRYLDETMARELSNCQRSGRSLGIIMLDIDHFKKYNDTHGHDAGDFVLVEVAALLQGKLRTGDIACRYGGEELVMVMPGASKEITAQRAEQMRAAIENHEFLYKGRNLTGVTASFGVASYPENGDNHASLAKCMDEALYEAKTAGRNCVIVAEELQFE